MLIFIINLMSSKNRKDLMTKKIENLAKKSHYRVFLESKLLNGQNFGEDLRGQKSDALGGNMPESKVAHLESSVNATESNPSKNACFQNDASNPSQQSLESKNNDVHLGVESSAFGTQMLEVENAISSLESSDNFEGLETKPPDLPYSEKGLKYDNFEKLESKPSDLSSGGEGLKRNNLKGLDTESSDLSSGGLVGVVDLESSDIDLPLAFINQNAESKNPRFTIGILPNSPLESQANHSPFESNADLSIDSKTTNSPVESNSNQHIESNAHDLCSGVTGKHLKVDSPIESPRNLSLDSKAHDSPLEFNVLDSSIDSQTHHLPLESSALDSTIESPRNLSLDSQPHHSPLESNALDLPIDSPPESHSNSLLDSKAHDSPFESNALDSPIESPHNSPESSHDLESHYNPNPPLESRPDSPPDSPPPRVLDPKAKPKEEFYFHFFDAICAESLESDKSHIKRYSPLLTKLVRGRELSEGELYCFASHFALWQKCLDLGEDIVILEDDMSFCDGFLETLMEIKDSHFEYVRLYHLIDKKLHHLERHFYISYANISGTQGYFLCRTGARKFIKNACYWFHCVDNYMDMFFINGVANIVYKPFCIYEDSILASDSTIKNRAKTRIGGGWKISREISRFVLFSVYKNLYLLYQMCKGKARLSGKK